MRFVFSSIQMFQFGEVDPGELFDEGCSLRRQQCVPAVQDVILAVGFEPVRQIGRHAASPRTKTSVRLSGVKS